MRTSLSSTLPCQSPSACGIRSAAKLQPRTPDFCRLSPGRAVHPAPHLSTVACQQSATSHATSSAHLACWLPSRHASTTHAARQRHSTVAHCAAAFAGAAGNDPSQSGAFPIPASPSPAPPSLAPSSSGTRNGPAPAAPGAAGAGAVPAPEEPPLSLGGKVLAFQQAFWKFLRPHTIRGTILGTTALTTRALLETPWLIDWGLLPKALMGLLALLCGNGFIVGINQIYDVDIDMVNKPFLPVASGELSPALAWVLCLLLAGGGMALTALNFSPLISGLYAFGLFLGTIYSVPPLRLKRFAIPAFLIIATVRGCLLNFGVYNATRVALGASFVWSPPITFITSFVTLFAVVIAVTKDLPDVDGDKANGIETFATRMGVKNVSLGAVGLLLANYVAAMWMALQPSLGFNPAVMFSAHACLALLLVFRAQRLDAAKYSRDAILAFYRWIWTLFYCEYAMFPFIQGQSQTT